MLAHQREEVIAEAAKGRATALPSALLGGEVWFYGRRHKSAARYYQRKLKKRQDMLNEFDLMEISQPKVPGGYAARSVKREKSGAYNIMFFKTKYHL